MLTDGVLMGGILAVLELGVAWVLACWVNTSHTPQEQLEKIP